MGPHLSAPGTRPKTGLVLVFVAILIVVLLAFSALAIDGGHMYDVKARCQATADAASLAAGKQLPDLTAARLAAQEYGTKNMDPALNGVVIGFSDVEFGAWNFNTRVFAPTMVASNVNAVRVTASRAASNANPVSLSFARAIGFSSADVRSSAVAAYASGTAWDVLLLQDVTASFAGELDLAKQADHNLLDCFASAAPPQSLFGIVTFTGWSHVVAPMIAIGGGFPVLDQAVENIRSCGSSGAPVCSGTDIAAGLEAAVGVMSGGSSGAGVGRAIVLVSDGQPEPNSNGSHPGQSAAALAALASQWADNAEAAGISINVVYYDGDNNPSALAFMRTLVRGGGVFLSTPDPNQLPNLLSGICRRLVQLRLVD